MIDSVDVGDEQKALWNGVAGCAWVEEQALLDTMFAPFERLLADMVDVGSTARLLDVGCGTGATTLAIAERLGSGGRCTGVDISGPMIALAKARLGGEADRADFLCADAGTHGFTPGEFDRLISRFGVMFFADPRRAFAHLRRATRPGGDLAMLAWRGGAENDFMTAAERAAVPLLAPRPPSAPDAPGQFAFARRDRVFGILRDAGWRDIAIEPADRTCAFPAKWLEAYFTRLGPVGRALPALDDVTRQRVIDALHIAFERYRIGDEIRFEAGCWLLMARAPSA